MSVDSNGETGPLAHDAAPLLARAANADRRADARLRKAVEDFFLGSDDRLDDRARAALNVRLGAILRSIEQELRDHASPHLLSNGHEPKDVFGAPGTAAQRLVHSGLLRDRKLIAELLSQVQQELLEEGLRSNRPPGAAPGLLVRLIASADTTVASTASAFQFASVSRADPDAMPARELPELVHRQLVWDLAAATRAGATSGAVPQGVIDEALQSASRRMLATHDETTRLDDAAMRLAGALIRFPDEIENHLVGAVEDGELALFGALLSKSLSVDFDEARLIVLDPDGDRLWVGLRALDVDRATIARIGLALGDADPRRDIEAFADEIDAIAAVPSDRAKEALAPLMLERDFRAALSDLRRADAQ
jgi:hypothetical protein